MSVLNAYNQHKQRALSRIDLIITLYRKCLDRLAHAEKLLGQRQPDAATALLAEAQVIVASLASGMAGSTDESAVRFVRLYEFVSHMIAKRTIDSLRAAHKVLTPLLEAFEAVRGQAALMEAQGLIAPLDREHQVQLSI